MSCSRLPPAGMFLAVVSTVPPPRIRRFTMASPIPLVPPVTRIRLPVNSFASYRTLDVLIGESPRSSSYCDLQAVRPAAPRLSEYRANGYIVYYSAPCALHGPIPEKRVGVIRVM